MDERGSKKVDAKTEPTEATVAQLRADLVLCEQSIKTTIQTIEQLTRLVESNKKGLRKLNKRTDLSPQESMGVGGLLISNITEEVPGHIARVQGELNELKARAEEILAKLKELEDAQKPTSKHIM